MTRNVERGFVVPRDSRGRISWAVLVKEQNSLRSFVETEVKAYIELGIRLSEPALKRVGRFDLVNAIRKYYPGGMQRLKEQFPDTLVRKPYRYWKGEDGQRNIRKEASDILKNGENLTHPFLRSIGRADLTNAIRLYPGGISQLNQDLGLHITKRRTGYWNIERIEQEALKYFHQHGYLVSYTLQRDYSALHNAIYDVYPGGISSLKNRLGIKNNLVNKQSILPDQANDQLRGLLEGENK